MATKKQKEVTKKEVVNNNDDYAFFEDLADQEDNQKNTNPEYAEFEELGGEEKGLLRQSLEDTLGGLKTVGKGALSGLAWVGDKYEKGISAPSRTFINELGQGNITQSLPRALYQVGADPKFAPTGSQVLETFGRDTKDELLLPQGSMAEGLIKEAGFKPPTSKQVEGMLAELAIDPAFIGKPIELAIKGGLLLGKGAAKATGVIGDLALGKNTVSLPINIAEKTLGSIKQSGLSPETIPSYEALLNTAKKIGIDEKDLSMSVKYGPDSTLSHAEKNVMQGAAGKDLMKKHKEVTSKIEDSFFNEINTIGKPLREDDAGKLIRDSVTEAQNKLFSDLESVTMKQASKEAPLSAYTKLESKKKTPFEAMKDWLTNKPKETPKAPIFTLDTEGAAKLKTTLDDAKKITNQALTDRMSTIDLSEAAELNRVIKSIEGITTYDDAVRKLQKLGKVAFEDPKKAIQLGKVTAPKKEMVDIYFTLQDAIIDTIRKKVDPKLADKIIENNQLMTMFFKDRNLIMPILESGRVPPEEVFRKLVGRGNSQRVQALKRILPENKFNELSATYINSLIVKNQKLDDTGKALDFVVNYPATLKNIDKNREFLTLILPETKITELEDILKLGTMQGGYLLNTSGTFLSELLSRGAAGLATAGKNRAGFEFLKNMAEQSKKATPRLGVGGYIGPQIPSRAELSTKTSGLIGRQPKEEER